MSAPDLAESLADLVESMLEKLDEEFEHGDYHAPDCVPAQFEDDEPDYYEAHGRIVNEVCTSRAQVEACIREIRSRKT